MGRGVKEGVKRGSYKKTEKKDKNFFGYRYTSDEVEYMRNILDDYKEEYGSATRALYEIFKKAEKGI